MSRGKKKHATFYFLKLLCRPRFLFVICFCSQASLMLWYTSSRTKDGLGGYTLAQKVSLPGFEFVFVVGSRIALLTHVFAEVYTLLLLHGDKILWQVSGEWHDLHTHHQLDVGGIAVAPDCSPTSQRTRTIWVAIFPPHRWDSLGSSPTAQWITWHVCKYSSEASLRSKTSQCLHLCHCWDESDQLFPV